MDYLFTQMDQNITVGSLITQFLTQFLGAFVAGKRQGQGAYLYINGDVYQGEWENDVKHGFGKNLV